MGARSLCHHTNCTSVPISIKHLHEDGFLITCPGRDLGLYRVADASRCKRLLENVEVTFMDGEVGIVVEKRTFPEVHPAK